MCYWFMMSQEHAVDYAIAHDTCVYGRGVRAVRSSAAEIKRSIVSRTSRTWCVRPSGSDTERAGGRACGCKLIHDMRAPAGCLGGRIY